MHISARTVSKQTYISYGTEPHPTLCLCKIIHVFFGTEDLLIVASRKGLGVLVGWENHRGRSYRWKLYLYQ